MTEYAAKRNPNRCPAHPGELLREEILPALRSPKSEAPDVAVRLGKAFGDGPGVWPRMQAAYDAWHAQKRVDVRKIPVLHAAE